MDEQLKNAFQRYRKYKSITRWLIPAFIGDVGLVLIAVFILVVGSHDHAPTGEPASGGMAAMLALLLVPIALLFPLAVILAAFFKCPFCGRRVRDYPSRQIHCIHCGRNIPEEFLAGE